jgi:hypothetical protein
LVSILRLSLEGSLWNALLIVEKTENSQQILQRDLGPSALNRKDSKVLKNPEISKVLKAAEVLELPLVKASKVMNCWFLIHWYQYFLSGVSVYRELHHYP